MRKYFDYICLFLIWAFHSCLNIYYIFSDTRPPAWDQSNHLLLSSTYAHLLSKGRFSEIIQFSNFYPPLLHILSAPLSSSYDTAILINLLFLAIILFSIYGIGRHLFNFQAGLISAFLISLFPFIIIQQRDFLLDFPLVAMVAASLWCLLKTDNFKNLRFSLLFGIITGLAVLMKWSAIIFLIVPILYILYRYIIEEKKCEICSCPARQREGFRFFCSSQHLNKFNKSLYFNTPPLNFLFSWFSFLLVASIWYIPHFSVFSTLSRGQQHWGSLEGDPTFFTFSGWWYYIKAVNIQVYLFFSILILLSLVFYFIKRENLEERIFLFLSILLPYLFFTFVHNKDVRYTLPLLIFFVLILGFGVSEIKFRDIKLRSLLLLIIFVVGMFQIAAITIGYSSHSEPVPNWVFPPPNSPKTENWQVDEVLDIVRLNIPQNSTYSLVMIVLPDQPYVNGLTYQYYALQKNLPLIVLNAAYISGDALECPIIFESYIERFDFILYKRGGEISDGGYKEPVKQMYIIFDSKINDYQLLDSFPLPDNSTVEIYMRK